MSLVATYLLPHPPLIFPEIGRGEERKIISTIKAYKTIAQEITKLQPDTIIIISPHVESFTDAFLLPNKPTVSGDMSQFQAPEVKLTLNIDQEFVDQLLNESLNEDFPVVKSQNPLKLDHATMVPARFIKQANAKTKLQYVTTGVTSLSPETHRRFGKLIANTSEKLGRKTVIIASGDLSHRLKDDSPYGFNENGPIFDEKILSIIKDADFDQLFEITPDFLDQAGECGYLPLCVMAGAIDQKPITSQLLSYEGPFGVGYCVASFKITQSPFAKLAQKTVEQFVKTGIASSAPQHLSAFPGEEVLSKLAMNKRAGVFVSIKKLGNLRGCIGTTRPTTESIANEIIQNAISASSRDPRFKPITADELPKLSYSVDILHPPEKIDDISQLNPAKYGVIVSFDQKQGLLLPNLEGIDTVEDQVNIALEKADIDVKLIDKVELKRFLVERYY